MTCRAAREGKYQTLRRFRFQASILQRCGRIHASGRCCVPRVCRLGSQFCEVNFFRSDVLRKFTYPAFKVARRVTGPTRFRISLSTITECIQVEPINDVPWWAAVQPMFLSVGAFAGLFALQAVARALLAGRAQLAHPLWAMTLMALAGVAAIVVVGVQVVPEQPGGLPAILCVYAPLLATAHILFISRRLFFKGR